MKVVDMFSFLYPISLLSSTDKKYINASHDLMAINNIISIFEGTSILVAAEAAPRPPET